MLGRRVKVPAQFSKLAGSHPILSYSDSQLGPIVASEFGLHLESMQINWYDLYQASFDPPILKIQFHGADGNRDLELQLTPILEPNDFPNLIRAKVTSNVIAQSQVEYEPGLQVTFSARRKNRDEINFVVTASTEIDAKSAEFRTWAANELREFKETFGF